MTMATQPTSSNLSKSSITTVTVAPISKSEVVFPFSGNKEVSPLQLRSLEATILPTQLSSSISKTCIITGEESSVSTLWPSTRKKSK